MINGRFDNSLSTPLIRACAAGCVDMVTFLIEKLDAQTILTNKNDENCLLAAVRGKSKNVVKYLCAKVMKPHG